MAKKKPKTDLNPGKAKLVKVDGPYEPYKPGEAWFYVERGKLNVHADFLIGHQQFHISLDIPTRGLR